VLACESFAQVIEESIKLLKNKLEKIFNDLKASKTEVIDLNELKDELLEIKKRFEVKNTVQTKEIKTLETGMQTDKLLCDESDEEEDIDEIVREFTREPETRSIGVNTKEIFDRTSYTYVLANGNCARTSQGYAKVHPKKRKPKLKKRVIDYVRQLKENSIQGLAHYGIDPSYWTCTPRW